MSGRKSPFPITLVIGLYNSLVQAVTKTVLTSRCATTLKSSTCSLPALRKRHANSASFFQVASSCAGVSPNEQTTDIVVVVVVVIIITIIIIIIIVTIIVISGLAVWLSGNALASITVVALRQTRLVLGWVTVCGRVNHFGM